MVRMEFIGGDKLAALLQGYSDKIQTAAVQSVGRSALRLQREVMRNRLTGQVLNVRTGNLRRSIHQKVETDGGCIIGEVNTNVRYGAAHEYGFSGAVNVKAHLRQVKQAFGKPLKSPRFVQVAAHSRAVNLPERSFLRSALRDLQPSIERSLVRAINKALRS